MKIRLLHLVLVIGISTLAAGVGGVLATYWVIEDEVQDLLGTPAPKAKAKPKAAPKPPVADSDFEDEFEKAVAGGAPGGDFDDETQSGATLKADDGLGGDEEEDFGDSFGAGLGDEPEEDEAPAPRTGGVEKDDEDDLFGSSDEEEEEEEQESGDFAGLQDEDDEEDDEEEEEEDEGQPVAGERLFPLEGEEGLGLDGKKKKKAKGAKKGRPVLLAVVLLLLIFVAGLVAYNFSLWNERDFMKEPPVIHLPFKLPIKLPFLRGPEQAAAEQAAEPGEAPTERIKLIQPVDFRQYIITNEKAGPIFVVEGKALNRFETPKARIQVMVSLYDAAGKVLAQKEQLCGNTLSLFQLQVQSEQEINDALNSKAGIYANNAFIKPGDTAPFMVVFFNPPDKVEEYQIKIVDARDPANN